MWARTKPVLLPVRGAIGGPINGGRLLVETTVTATRPGCRRYDKVALVYPDEHLL